MGWHKYTGKTLNRTYICIVSYTVSLDYSGLKSYITVSLLTFKNFLIAYRLVFIPTCQLSDCGTRRWAFSSFLPVFWIRKYFFRIRILGSVILHYGFGSGRPINCELARTPDPDPTKTFVWSLNKVCCQIGSKSLNMIKY